LAQDSSQSRCIDSSEILCIVAMRVTVLLLFASAASSEAERKYTRGSVVPSLHPESDSKFFSKDYPDDLRPKVVNQFDHPYPSVQDSSDYDKDYVKDENNDNGEWTAQMEYDRLKNKLAREKEMVQKAKAKMEEEKWEWEQVKKFEQDAEKAARKAEGESANAAAKAAGAEGAAGDSATEVGSETNSVEKETDDLQGCEKELAHAKELLNKLHDEVASAEGGAASAYGEYSEAEAHARSLEAKESALEKKVEGEMLSYDQLVKLYKLAVKELEDLENEVDKAAKKLKKYQAMDPGAKDGVIGLNAHSSANRVTFSSLAVCVGLSFWFLN